MTWLRDNNTHCGPDPLISLDPSEITVFSYCRYGPGGRINLIVQVHLGHGSAALMFDSMRKAIAWLEPVGFDIAPLLDRVEFHDYELAD